MDTATALALPRSHSPRIARLHAFREKLRGYEGSYPLAAPMLRQALWALAEVTASPATDRAVEAAARHLMDRFLDQWLGIDWTDPFSGGL